MRLRLHRDQVENIHLSLLATAERHSKNYRSLPAGQLGQVLDLSLHSGESDYRGASPLHPIWLLSVVTLAELLSVLLMVIIYSLTFR